MKTPASASTRRARVVLFALLLALGAGAAASAAPQNIDLVVMVDTSESMFPYFDDLMNYLVQDLLTSRLHRGDTFHLISFSSVPEVETSLEVNSEEAARQAFGRVLLLHALGRYTDLVAAMQFLYKYAKELPETNPKQIIVITDGIHDPPPGSPNRGDPAVAGAALLDVAQAMRKEGWAFNILKVPPQPSPEDAGQKSYLSDIAQALGVAVVPYPTSDKEHVTGRTTGYPTLTFPAALGKVGTKFVAPFRVKNWKAEPIIVRLSGVQSDGSELLEKKLSLAVPAMGEAALDVPLRLPVSYPKGDHEARVQLVFDDDLRISPTAGVLTFTYTGKGGLPIPRVLFLYVLYIILGLAVLYLLVRLFLYMRKKLGEAPLTGLARAQAGLAAPAGRPGVAVTRTGTPARTSRVPLIARATSGGPGGGTPSHAAPVRVPLMAAHAAAPARRVRPTVTSIQRAVPRAAFQQASLPPLIEMRVGLQNHRIGFRNVHRIAPGSVKTIGGRFSAFLVFLVPVPSNIAEIRNVDGRFVFTPLRTELFPGVPGPVEDCLGREIPFVNAKGRELSLHFRQWVSLLDEVNSIMRKAHSPMP